MRHRMGGRKLGRKTPHRRMMFRNMVTSLLDKERIRTTLPRAKEIRPLAEKMITLGKRETLHSRRKALAFIKDPAVVKKLFDTIAPRFAQRPGGYTRIIRLGFRDGDGAQLAILELLGSEFKPVKGEETKADKKRKKAAQEAAAGAVKEASETPKEEKKKKVKQPAAEKKEKQPKAKAKEKPQAEAKGKKVKGKAAAGKKQKPAEGE